MVKYMLAKIDKCPECKGEGELRQKIWDAYDRHFEGRKHQVTEEEAVKFFRDEGMVSIDHAYDIPEEHAECWNCGGSGEETTMIELGQQQHTIWGDWGQLLRPDVMAAASIGAASVIAACLNHFRDKNPTEEEIRAFFVDYLNLDEAQGESDQGWQIHDPTT